MEKTVLLLTENFPYPPGEQFLEEEVIYWNKFFNGKLIILPVHAIGVPRSLPENIEVELCLSKNVSYFHTFLLTFRALFSKVFFKEVIFLWSVRKFKLRCFGTALKSTVSIFKFYDLLKNYLKRFNEKPLIYTYWFTTLYYSSALLKRKDLVGPIVSRAHGYDVYEERKFNHYMPLKRQFIKELDRLSAISKKGKIYLCETYGIPEKKVKIDRLGVKVSGETSPPTDPGTFVILSVSFCVEVKNIHKIIEAIGIISRQKQEVKFVWHHIGDGPLRSELEQLASQSFTTSNISWEFHGMISSDGVKKFYQEHNIDVFINASQSEGVPVSIMEAMDFGVPAVAPDVGGISELVNNNHGILLTSNPTAGELSVALNKIEFLKSKETRSKAKNFIAKNYNAERNYFQFVNIFEDLNF